MTTFFMPFSRVPRRFWIALLGLGLLAAFAFVLLRSGPLAPVRVTVVAVEAGSVSPALFGIGTVEARRAYLVGPTSAGRVLKVLVDVGEPVKAGQLLAEMDPVDLDERVIALDASLARAQSALTAAGAQREDALARHRLAGMNAQRYIDLGGKKFVSASAVESREQEQVSARAIVDAAEANLAGARHEVLRFKAERDGLRQQRRNARLLAPGDGVVTARDAEPGSTVVAGQAVIRLIDPGSLWIRARLDQGRSAGLAVGLPAAIALRSDPARKLPGKVVRLELLSDSVTEERIAQIAFDHIPASVSLGELAEVTLTLKGRENGESGLLLPNASIKRQGNKSGVWLLDNDRLRFAELTLGPADLDGRVAVLAGLKAGDRVVVYSDKELVAGSRVEVVESLTGKPAGTAGTAGTRS